MYHSQDGKIPPNSAVGRLLMETVSMVPQIDSSQFEQMMNSAMQVYIVCDDCSNHHTLSLSAPLNSTGPADGDVPG